MRVPQEKPLDLYLHSPVLSSFHVTPKTPVSRTIQERCGGARFRSSRTSPHRDGYLRYLSLRILPSSLVSVTNFWKFLLYNSLSNSWASSGSNQKTWLFPALVTVSRT